MKDSPTTPDIMEKARELADRIIQANVISGEKGNEYIKVQWSVLSRGIAAALAEARVVPDGWKLVPVEPDVMIIKSGKIAFRNERDAGADTQKMIAAYKAMIAAAPNPPIAGEKCGKGELPNNSIMGEDSSCYDHID